MHNICDRAWENRPYIHKIHLFVLWHVSPIQLGSVSFIEFLMDFCIYDDILNTIRIADKKLFTF